jgi:hypothetical protein
MLAATCAAAAAATLAWALIGPGLAVIVAFWLGMVVGASYAWRRWPENDSVVIDADDLAEARADPKVSRLIDDAREYGQHVSKTRDKQTFGDL